MNGTLLYNERLCLIPESTDFVKKIFGFSFINFSTTLIFHIRLYPTFISTFPSTPSLLFSFRPE